jgi:hypothetical protein
MNVETDLPARRVNGRMWQPGESGNPAGRPVGARGRFSQQFVEDMRASWERHGATVMDRVAVKYPDRYLGIAAHLIPKEVTATIEAGSGVLDAECMPILQAIKESLPSANPESPEAVLKFVADAVREKAARPAICGI